MLSFLYIYFFLISRWCHIRTSCTKIPKLVLLWSTLCQLSVWPNYDWNAFSFCQQQCKLFAIAWTCVFPVWLNQFVIEYPGNSGLVSSNSQRTAWGWRPTYWKKILSHQVTFFLPLHDFRTWIIITNTYLYAKGPKHVQTCPNFSKHVKTCCRLYIYFFLDF